MTLALDTNVFIDLLRGRRASVRQRHAEAILGTRPLVTSLVVFHELHFGIAASPNSVAEADAVAIVLRGVSIEPLTEQDMIRAAEVRARLRRTGRPIGGYDGLIAGQALERGWTLVTSNVREFDRVEGLALENWGE
ncbi:type II toxin-antitoxin system VapC family toxin [Caulobacter vibrioides]|uniref:type II toxin-antitoxin system VapC family toxin n=1 Tax=Caulobacter vibrioides TaxID=155892 RepID=UPI0015E77594|nr:type II toxin-antitoxin system VapC family toxin [Caulobacter vibrioides]